MWLVGVHLGRQRVSLGAYRIASAVLDLAKGVVRWQTRNTVAKSALTPLERLAPFLQPSMSRRSLSLLLSLFLLFGQACGAVHALSHIHVQLQGNPCATPADTDQCGPGDPVCLQCLAFAAATVAMPSLGFWLLIACARRWHYPLFAARYIAPIISLRPRSRGPPLSGRSSA